MIDIPQTICSRCGGEMPLLRKKKFGYDFCVNCSNVEPKVGHIVQYGPGEDTWCDLILCSGSMDNSYRSYTDVNSLEEDEIIE